MAGTTMRLLVHAGAANAQRDRELADLEAEMRSGLEQALKAGHAVLMGGGSSLDSVVVAVGVMEDFPLFNAGRGSVLTSEGRIEMDAAIMDGRDRRAGAVACVSTIRHPVHAARAVMEHSPHVLLMGAGAEAFAGESGCELVSPHHFVVPGRYERWLALRGTGNAELDHAGAFNDNKHGTVGAVAIDGRGDLAAATSTGGITNKMPGRVGDSPLLGAGTYASNRSLAVSFTGTGEHVIRIAGGHLMAMLMEHRGLSLGQAMTAVLAELQALGGEAGIIAVDRTGAFCIDCNTNAMLRGCIDAEGRIMTGMFFDDGIMRFAG